LNLHGKAKSLSIYIGSHDQFDGKPLYHAIVERARSLGLAGATVVEGIEGYGAASRIHRAGLLDLSIDLPVIIEIIDTEEKIDANLVELTAMVSGGMITLRECEIIHYLPGPKR
jgi:PII-like signaling protein